ncbi:MAG: N-acetyl-gamma-glutamyl-phosphate reductase [Gemmatimonadota bacterium]
MNKTATGSHAIPAAPSKLAKAIVLGGTGYTGQEVIGLLARHPGIELATATSESEAGARIGGTSLRYQPIGEVDLEGADVVFSCLPHGESGDWTRRAASAGAVAIDLSSDLRGPDSGATYGLPELWRSQVREARLIANPGCYPTGVLLGLAPAVTAGLVDRTKAIVIDAASGVTGAGRSAKRDLLFGEVAEDYRAYGVGNLHRHVPEMRVGLNRLSGIKQQFVFTPHLLPVRRGILETIYLPLTQRLSLADAASIWSEFYAGEPFIEITGAELPSLRAVTGSNRVAFGFSMVEGVESPLLIVVAAFDNLVKGAAGQALQNANLALGYAETAGLIA